MKYPNNINDIEDFTKHLNAQIIVLDGLDGAGKTSLAKKISAKFSIPLISIDDFLIKKRGGYFNEIKFDELEQSVEEKLKNDSLLIEGILMLKVLNQLKLREFKLIYMADSTWIYNWTENGSYHNKQLEEIIKSKELLINRINAASGQKTNYTMKGLRREMYDYTFKYNPINKADLIVESQL